MSVAPGLEHTAQVLLYALDQCETAEEQTSLVVAALQDTERAAVGACVRHLHLLARDGRAEAQQRGRELEKLPKELRKARKGRVSEIRTQAQFTARSADALWSWWQSRR